MVFVAIRHRLSVAIAALAMLVGCGGASQGGEADQESKGTTSGKEQSPALAANGQIAFSRSGDIWVADPTGRHPRRLTKPPVGSREYGPFYSSPAWSPDGSEIAFTETTFPTHEYDELRVMRPDGTNVEKVTQGNLDFDPSWSPDGRQLAFSAGSVLATVPLETHASTTGLESTGRVIPLPDYCSNAYFEPEEELCQTATPLAEESDMKFFEDRMPAWSPQGNWISFVRWLDGQPPRLMLVRPEGGKTQPLAGLLGSHPDWSPDGESIAFHDGGDLYVVRLADKTVMRLTQTELPEGSPTWSPDGTKILFERGRAAGESASVDVWVMNRNGTGQSKLIQNAGQPDWQPVRAG